MTANDDLDQQLSSFLREGPTELPYQSFDAVRDRTEQTRQRAFMGPRRTPIMSKFVIIGLGAAAVVVIGIFLGGQLLGTPTNLGGPGAEPSATVEATETAEPTVSQEARTLTFDIEPMATGGQARGTVVVDIAGGGYTMTITVENLVPNGQYPITMFAGQCPTPYLPGPDTPGYVVEIVRQTPADDSGTLMYEKEFEGLWEIPETGRTLIISGRVPAESNTNIACADLTQ